MRYFKGTLACFLWCCFVISLLPSAVLAQIPRPETYLPTLAQVEKYKAPYDDPRPLLKEFGPKQVLPKELYEMLCYDEEKMKSLWAELVGFRAPDVVGKIAPEIKPGKYTYKDLEKYPGFKELMYPDLYNRIKPGGPPHAGNIPEFEVIPTRQYYYALPVAEATKQNLGKTKLDKDGYIISETWTGGYPFPQPSGPFKAQQIMFNVEKRSNCWDQNFRILGWIHGYNKNLKLDFGGIYEVQYMRLAGRTLLPPFGWYDDRAKDNGEFKTFNVAFWAPRDISGTVESVLCFLDPKIPDQLMIYIPSLRRVRKLTATDTQDPVMGQDLVYDDNEGWNQKLSPTRYPYKFEVVDEREFLYPAYTLDGSEYVSSKGMEFRNVKFERRPMYVVKLTQKDPNYVYGKRIFYIDKETFNYLHIENYDQKGRLYRTYDRNYSFFPEMGMFAWSGGLAFMRDYLDLHSTVSMDGLQLPALWNRGDVSLEGIVKKAK